MSEVMNVGWWMSDNRLKIAFKILGISLNLSISSQAPLGWGLKGQIEDWKIWTFQNASKSLLKSKNISKSKSALGFVLH